MTNSPNDNLFVNRLTGLSYRDVDEDFVRFRDVEGDDTVKSALTPVVLAEPFERDQFRAALTSEGIDTLRLYAKRRTLQARRRSSMNLVDDAMEAFALIPAGAEVPWDTWLKAGLFIARSLGRDIELIAERFGELSSLESAQRFDVAFEAMSRVESLGQCFISEVMTNYGTGFIETIVHRDTKSTGSIFSAPRRADDVVPYNPTTNLAQLTASLADAYDASESLHTSAIAQDQLAGMSFSQQVSGAFLEATGCLSFYADAASDDGSFKVFVAELPDGTDVEALASGAERDDQAVVFDATRLILLVAPPNFDDEDDEAFVFEGIVNVARESLWSSVPVGWHNR